MKKGFTTVELIVTFALSLTIAIFLFQIILFLKNLYTSYGLKTELLNKQSLLSYKINDEFNNKKINTITKCGSYCLNFLYIDDSISQLYIDVDNKTITFNDEKTNFPDGTFFKDIDINVYISPVFDEHKNDSLVMIDIPVYNDSLKDENFGIKTVYQYNSLSSNITKVIFDGQANEYGTFILKGNPQVTVSNMEPYKDLGFLVLDKDGNLANQNLVTIENPLSSMTLPYKFGKYDIKYHYKDTLGNIIETKTRTVTVEEKPLNFSYTGSVQTFIAPVTGTYKIELWGAQGGESYSGVGGYTSGNIILFAGETLYIYVGGQPQSVVVGGYNGGGISNSDGRYQSGGGSTDVRLAGGLWNDTNGLRSRIMVAGGGGGGSFSFGALSGGAGGGLLGVEGNRSGADNGSNYITLAQGGSQNSGGTGGTGSYAGGYVGMFGYGGNGVFCCLAGGGGGYYGGGSSGVATNIAGTGAGGSSFISGHNGCDAINSSGIHTNQSNHYSGKVFLDTLMIDGQGYKWTNSKIDQEKMPKPEGGYYELGQGHTGHGYARISLIPTTKVYMTNLLSNASFENTGWTACTYSTTYKKYGNYSCQLNGTTAILEKTTTNSIQIELDNTHIYYSRVEGYQATKTGSFDAYWPVAEPALGRVQLGSAGQWNIYSVRNNRATFSNGKYPLRFDFNNVNVESTVYYDGGMLIDLTATFGKGNEPTKEWCDTNIPFFEGSNIVHIPIS